MALDIEIAAFERQREAIERHHSGKFVVFHGEELIGAFDTFDAAARSAVLRYGRGPYLICLIRLRAEHRCGQLLAEEEKDRGGRPQASGNRSQHATSLADYGVSKTQSSCWQKLAAVPALPRPPQRRSAAP